MTENLAVVKQPQELVNITMTAGRLSEALSEEQNKRELIKKYIQTNLTPNVDFGKINMGGRESKECLFKPGAEKVCSLLHLNPVFKVDAELIPIVGEGVIPYICQLVNRHTGEVEGEGRGACSLKEKQGNVNTAIKIAQKRAQIDAVLRVAAISDTFTQDLDDLPPPAPYQAKVMPRTVQTQSATPPPNSIPTYDYNTREEIKVTLLSDQQEAPHTVEHKLTPSNVSTEGRCTFGKNKGMLWADMNEKQLAWYRDMFMSNINDPEKEKYVAGNKKNLQEVLDALEAK